MGGGPNLTPYIIYQEVYLSPLSLLYLSMEDKYIDIYIYMYIYMLFGVDAGIIFLIKQTS